MENKVETTEIVETKKNELTDEQKRWKNIIETYLENTNTKLNQSELQEFKMLCKEHNLNPLKREIYAIKYKDKFNVCTNYYEYVKRADKTGLLTGYKIDINVQTGVGTFTGYRKDWVIPLEMKFFLKEWKQTKFDGTPMGLWATKPYFMFEKCILANGLRRLFPNELGNMPYINEELWFQSQENDKAIKEHVQREEKVATGVLENDE